MNETKYILYKRPISLDTLYIVQYLHFLGISLEPHTIIERQYPPHVTALPTIDCNGILYIGLAECVAFYEIQSQIRDILSLSYEFKILYPRYTIKP